MTYFLHQCPAYFLDKKRYIACFPIYICCERVCSLCLSMHPGSEVFKTTAACGGAPGYSHHLCVLLTSVSVSNKTIGRQITEESH